jgi:hypothetical protein
MRHASGALQEMLPVPTQSPASPTRETIPEAGAVAVVWTNASPAAASTPNIIEKTSLVAVVTNPDNSAVVRATTVFSSCVIE